MKTILIDGKLCVGPHFTETEFVMMRKNLSQQKLLDILGELLNSVGNPAKTKIVHLLFAHKEFRCMRFSRIIENIGFCCFSTLTNGELLVVLR